MSVDDSSDQRRRNDFESGWGSPEKADERGGGGGGGGYSPHDWLRTRVVDRVCFSAIRRRRRFH